MEITFDETFCENIFVKQLLEMTPIKISAQNQKHIIVFRRLLEISLSQGRWMGFFPEVS